MTTRLPIAACDVARVAALAQVGEATVRRYRRMSGDGVTPRHGLRRAQEAAITKAAAELPPVAQVELFASTQQVLDRYLPDPPKPPPVAQLDIDSALIVGDDSAPARHLDEGVSRAARRCRVTFLLVATDGSESEIAR